MTAAIIRGVDKADSHLVTDSESSELWDERAVSLEATRAAHPGAVIEIPNDPPC